MLQLLPDSLILKILNFLEPLEVVKVSECSTILREVCQDQLLWRDLFHRYFHIPSFYQNPLVRDDWLAEFIRLYDQVPIVQSEEINVHSDQVLHVSYSHDGNRFATTGKDACIYIWKSTMYPVEQEYSYNMERFSWKYTQFSQFNESDSLLLVSGVQFGTYSTSGEIAIFGFKNGFELRCRTSNKPYDIFGSWYTDTYFFSADLHWLDNLISKSVIWLNKASQEAESEHKAIMNRIFKFYNPQASSIRSLLIANCVQGCEISTESICTTSDSCKPNSNHLVLDNGHYWKTRRDDEPGNQPSKNLALRLAEIDASDIPRHAQPRISWKKSPQNNVSSIDYTEEFHKTRFDRTISNNDEKFDDGQKACSSKNLKKFQSSSNSGDVSINFQQSSKEVPSSNSSVSSSSGDISLEEVEDTDVLDGSGFNQPVPSTTRHKSEDSENSDEEDKVMDPREKLMIFTCGSETYTPHQIGFKRLKPFQFKGRLELGMTLAQRIQEKKRREEEPDDDTGPPMDYRNYESVAHLFDKPDSILDLRGHIIGMTLSPDHRYLYVNCRPWPTEAIISNPLRPPPIAQEIDIHVIDLVTLRQVGMMHKAHRAYTPHEECFFIFLDTCEEYLASGAEDRAGYVWDRHYGIPLCSLPHTDVVNSVAFNPKNSEILVTVSDDSTAKIWRSKRLCRELGINYHNIQVQMGTRLYLNKKRTVRTPNVNNNI